MFSWLNARYPARLQPFIIVAVAAALLGVVLASVGLRPGRAGAETITTSYAAEPFTGTAVGNPESWTKPMLAAREAADNQACLTASDDVTQARVPGCGSAADTPGGGVLRLTPSGYNQSGGLAAVEAGPLSQGLDVTFRSYQYGGSGADGIAFYLAAVDPFQPAVTKTIGAPGGSLGYSSSGQTPGLPDGYLGIGLDAYGNFRNQASQGSGCTGPSVSVVPSVSVRGPGNETQGYCLLSTNEVQPNQLRGADRATSSVPVEIVVNRSSEPATSRGLSDADGTVIGVHTIAPTSFAVFYRLAGSTAIGSLTGALPRVMPGSSGYDARYYDADGYPYKLTYGWVASTGGSTDVHEIDQFQMRSLSGPAPLLGATDSGPLTTTTGTRGAYTVTPQTGSAGNDHGENIQVTTTFPPGLTPLSGTAATAWTCSEDGQHSVCTSVDNARSPASGDIPALLLPYTADADASPAPLTISSSIRSSSTTNTVYTSSPVTVIPRATSTTLHTSSEKSVYGDPVTLTAVISPTDERELAGTVTFTNDLGTTLCTVPVESNTASCVTGALEVGDRRVVAHYGGHTNDGPSDSTEEPVHVTRIPSALVATVSPARSEYGTPITLKAAGLTASSTGTITFIDTETDTALCQVEAAGSSVVACTPSAPLGVGDHALRAVYSPSDAVHVAPTTTSDVPYRIDRVTFAATTLINGNRTAIVTYGAPMPLSISGVPAGATGDVSFTEGKSLLCLAVLPATHCTPSSALPTGEHMVHASYSGDHTYAPVAAASATLSVNKRHISVPTVKVRASETYGQHTRFDLADSTIPADATGTVTYLLDDTTLLCSVALPATACVAAHPGEVGVHGVTAFYSGDGNYEEATSPARLFRITKIATVLAITGTPTTAWGTRSHVAISGLPRKATGTVTVSQGKRTLCTVHLPDSTCTIDSIEPGTATIKGSYSGDATYAGSSAAKHVTVTSTHTHNNKPQESSDPHVAEATWPAVREADTYMVNVYADAQRLHLLRTVTIPAPRTSIAIDQLRSNSSYWYRVTTMSKSGVVLSEHDGVLRTAASPTSAVKELAETGPNYEPKTLGLSLLVLFGAGFFLLCRGKVRSKKTVRR